MGKSTAAERADGREGGHRYGFKPQTTRNRILGVVEVAARKGKKQDAHPSAQIVFVDTPGVHKPGSHLDRRMLQEVYEALETRDVVLVLMDASRRMKLGEQGTGKQATGNREQATGDATADPSAASRCGDLRSG